MYVHCHHCGWEQDDFWDEHYHPLRFDAFQVAQLLEGDLEASVDWDDYLKKQTGVETNREALLHSLEQHCERVENMRWRTLKEFRERNPGLICPICKRASLDVD